MAAKAGPRVEEGTTEEMLVATAPMAVFERSRTGTTGLGRPSRTQRHPARRGLRPLGLLLARQGRERSCIATTTDPRCTASTARIVQLPHRHVEPQSRRTRCVLRRPCTHHKWPANKSPHRHRSRMMGFHCLQEAPWAESAGRSSLTMDRPLARAPSTGCRSYLLCPSKEGRAMPSAGRCRREAFNGSRRASPVAHSKHAFTKGGEPTIFFLERRLLS